MKTFFNILLFLLLTIEAIAQSENHEFVVPKDSVLTYQGINPRLNIPDQIFELDLQFKFWRQDNNMLTEGNDANLWLRTELALSSSGSFNQDNPVAAGNFSAPLYEQYLENQKFNPLYYVLGMAQTAAVGYMAYQHIKKYGLFK